MLLPEITHQFLNHVKELHELCLLADQYRLFYEFT
jgi:hypothetical protein